MPEMNSNCTSEYYKNYKSDECLMEKKCYCDANLCCYVKDKNYETFQNNLKILDETLILFTKMVEIIEKHKFNLTQLVEEVTERGIVDEYILKKLDSYVNLLLLSLQKYTNIKKCYEGLGEKNEHLHYSSDDSENYCSNNSTLDYQLLSMLYGGLLQSKKCKYFSSVDLCSIALNSPIQTYVSIENKEIFIKYKFLNDGTHKLCFAILWSHNIVINPSCIGESSESDDCCISVQQFIKKIFREIKNMSALSGIFSTESDRFLDNMHRFKNLVNKLVPI